MSVDGDSLLKTTGQRARPGSHNICNPHNFPSFSEQNTFLQDKLHLVLRLSNCPFLFAIESKETVPFVVTFVPFSSTNVKSCDFQNTVAKRGVSSGHV